MHKVLYIQAFRKHCNDAVMWTSRCQKTTQSMRQAFLAGKADSMVHGKLTILSQICAVTGTGTAAEPPHPQGSNPGACMGKDWEIVYLLSSIF
jgi:hypothetical protein